MMDWQEKASHKKRLARDKIPQDWLLPEIILSELRFPLEANVNRLIDLKIPQRSGILSERELSITENYNVQDLVKKLAAGEFSSVEVTLAFSKRAAIAQQLTNCLTETYFDEAIARAKELDALRSQRRLGGPLHGLPISIKDSNLVKGSEATIGFVSFLGKIAERNSSIVDILLESGAVIYVKTNIPQTMMTMDSQNNIFGRTLNPHNTILGAGGSSGGEGALVAFRGSPLGIGTDVGGSIRVPALCNGIYGFKPTASRIPYGGQAHTGLAGGDFFLACAGPLANDFNALEFLTKTIIDAQPARFDSSAIDVPWRDLSHIPKTKLRLGMLEDPAFPLHPPVKRIMNEAAQLLQAQGHEIVLLPHEKCHVRSGMETAIAFLGFRAPDNAAAMAASGEPPVPSVVAMTQLIQTNPKDFLADIEASTDFERLKALRRKRRIINEDWRQLWSTYKLDAVICPVAQQTALGHDCFLLPPYTIFLNTLDYPSCVIPFGKASKSVDSAAMVLEPQQLCASYDPELTDGAPCGIQIFTSTMRDEECLQVSQIVNACLHPAA